MSSAAAATSSAKSAEAKSAESAAEAEAKSAAIPLEVWADIFSGCSEENWQSKTLKLSKYVWVNPWNKDKLMKAAAELGIKVKCDSNSVAFLDGKMTEEGLLLRQWKEDRIDGRTGQTLTSVPTMNGQRLEFIDGDVEAAAIANYEKLSKSGRFFHNALLREKGPEGADAWTSLVKGAKEELHKKLTSSDQVFLLGYLFRRSERNGRVFEAGMSVSLLMDLEEDNDPEANLYSGIFSAAKVGPFCPEAIEKCVAINWEDKTPIKSKDGYTEYKVNGIRGVFLRVYDDESKPDEVYLKDDYNETMPLGYFSFAEVVENAKAYIQASVARGGNLKVYSEHCLVVYQKEIQESINAALAEYKYKAAAEEPISKRARR